MDIAQVLAALPDSAKAHGLVDAYLRRLEDGLADARRELSRVHRLLENRETTMTDPVTQVTIAAADLAAALNAVRFAVSTDPALPALGGVLVDAAADGLEFVPPTATG